MDLEDDDNEPKKPRIKVPREDEWYRKHGKQPKDPTVYVPRYNGTRYYEE